MRSLSSIAHWYVAAEKIRRSFEAICLYKDTVATGDKDVTGSGDHYYSDSQLCVIDSRPHPQPLSQTWKRGA
ncbi:MAG: hypothetical protein PUP92_38485 [Rhizonema sp. PD38]|nr:hypothetical protein [Rhizonema sp. PD38]